MEAEPEVGRQRRAAARAWTERAAACLLLWLCALCLATTGARAQDFDGDGIPDASDNCVFEFNPTQLDNGGINTTTPDFIGDACQCGDVGSPGPGGDGIVDGTDAQKLTDWLLGLAVLGPDELARCSVIWGTECNLVDLVVLRHSAALLLPTVSQVCEAAVP